MSLLPNSNANTSLAQKTTPPEYQQVLVTSLRQTLPIGSPALVKTLQPRSSWKWRVLDVTVAGGMLLVSIPLLCALGLVVWIVDGRPVFYRGRRLGLNREPFTILKFRSLKTDAEKRMGGTLLTDSHDHKTRTGTFLRETRLDELPQLFLVISGKMALFGPRPERPEVYAAKCKSIEGYRDRFLVTPGVFGYSQILTPHGTPKRVRALIDRRFVHVQRPLKFEIALLSLTLASLVCETATRVGRFAKNLWHQKLIKAYAEKRRLRRIEPAHFTTVLMEGATPSTSASTLVDLNAEAFLARGAEANLLSVGDKAILLISQEDSSIRHRARIRITHTVLRTNLDDANQNEVVARYKPWSENSSYFIEQYLLDKSIVQLPRTMRMAANPNRNPI